MKHKSLLDIITNRKRQQKVRQTKNQLRKSVLGSYQQQQSNIKLENFSRKNNLTIDEKLQLLSQIERKYRMNFTAKFNINNTKWLTIEKNTIIDKNYDFAKKSYFILKGKVKIVEKVQKTVMTSQDLIPFQKRGKILKQIDGQGAIGLVFCYQQLPICTIMAEQALIFQVHHLEGLEEIQKNCLMISKEKQAAVKRFKIFESIQNMSKAYIPYFRAQKYIKGQHIYSIGDESEFLYLIIEGQIEFSSLITQKVQQKNKLDENKLKKIIRPQNHTESFTYITQILNEDNYFGEQEILSGVPRNQNAICHSIQCVLLIIPKYKLSKLMNYQQFIEGLEVSALNKQRERQIKIKMYKKMKIDSIGSPKQQDTKDGQNFSSLKRKIFKRLSEEKENPQQSFSNSKGQRRICHGHSLSSPHSTLKSSDQTYSMLTVNKKMYAKTFKRYRLRLQQIQHLGIKKKRTQYEKGRSLSEVWKVLGLQKTYNEGQVDSHMTSDEENGKQYYDSHVRLRQNLKNSRACRPKALTTSCTVKVQYLNYLQRYI